MNFSVKKKEFVEAISDVRKAVSSATHVPAQLGIKIIADHHGLTLIGSNADLFIERQIPLSINGTAVVNIQEPGQVVISSKHFSEIIKKLPSDISIEVKNHRFVSIHSEEIITHLTQINSEDYPLTPEIYPLAKVSLHRDDFIEVIRQTVFAVSKNESRPALTGVHMRFEDQKFTCIATNSIRLALRELPLEIDCHASFIVPSTALTEFIKLSSSYSELVDISFSETHMLISSRHIKLMSRLIGGHYPNTAGLIPERTSTEIVLDRTKLLNGIERACLMTSESKHNNVNLEIIAGKKVKISSNSSEYGHIYETQNILELEGHNELKISFDGKFMIDALRGINDDNVKLSFDGSMRPIIIKPVMNQDQLHLISPVRT